MTEQVDPDIITIVRTIESCIPNLKSGLEDALRGEEVVFFPSIILGKEIHVQPIILPVVLANAIATELFKLDRMDVPQMGKHLRGVWDIMSMNAVSPAPEYLHVKFLGMFEAALYTGMHDQEEVVMDLTRLTAGDLAMLQIILEPENHQVTTGMRVVKNPLQVWETPMNYVFPDNMDTRH